MCATLNRKPEAIPVRDYEADDYRVFWSGNCKSLLHQFECRIVEEALPKTPGWLIDVGGGYGRLLPTYFRSDRQIVVLDYTINLLEIASKAYPYDNVHYLAADAYHMPFRSEVFSLGLSVRTFHHMIAPQLFVDEISRVMHGDSRFLLTYSNKRTPLRMLRHGLGSFRHDHERYGEMLYGTHPAFFAKLVGNAGLEVIGSKGTGFVDQVAIRSGLLDRALAKGPFLGRMLTIAEEVADSILGRLELAPLTFALLRKAEGTTAQGSSCQRAGPSSLLGILECPYCHSPELEQDGNRALACPACGRKFKRYGTILDFR